VSVMVTVTDSNGNISTGMATVTVADNTPPTLSTQDVALSLDASGNAALTVDQVEVESADNCGIASKVLSQSSFDCDDTGVNTVTLTVTDNAGNQTVNTFNVTISDDTAPTVIAQDLTIALDNDGL
ncbi:HYR domain-containing protein, partial [Roseivirga sp. 4D4]|uniref:HYR domain-containing protein n=1 Tax=Roseivirga sp. 4D4 TaxID=1889784 RepID=UPI001112EE6E